MEGHQFLLLVQSTVVSDDHHHSIKMFVFPNITRFGFRLFHCLRQLVGDILQQRPGFKPKSVHLGFVVEKVTLG